MKFSFLYSEHIHHQHFLHSPETTLAPRAATATCDMIYRKHRRASRLLYFVQHLPGYVSVTSKKEERRDTWSKSDKSVIQTFIRVNHCPLLEHYLSPPNHISALQLSKPPQIADPQSRAPPAELSLRRTGGLDSHKKKNL